MVAFRCPGEVEDCHRSSRLNSNLRYVMLSCSKRPDPIWRNPSSQDEPDCKRLPGAIIGLSVHVVALIERTRTYNGIIWRMSKTMDMELKMEHNGPQVQHSQRGKRAVASSSGDPFPEGHAPTITSYGHDFQLSVTFSLCKYNQHLVWHKLGPDTYVDQHQASLLTSDSLPAQCC